VQISQTLSLANKIRFLEAVGPVDVIVGVFKVHHCFSPLELLLLLRDSSNSLVHSYFAERIEDSFVSPPLASKNGTEKYFSDMKSNTSHQQLVVM
jgi:hypothetical protein